MIIDMMPLVLALVGAGLLAGFIAGLLGVGGGIVTISVLFVVFESLDYSAEWHMHMAIATSLAIIIPTNISSVLAHSKKDSVDWDIVKKWAVFLAIGALIGSGVAKQLKTDELVYIFATLAGLLAVKMMLPMDGWQLGAGLPRGFKAYIPPSLIGFFSAVMGIGGGSFSVPYLTLHGVTIHRAIGTASLAGLVISICGGLGYLIGGLSVEGLPDSNICFINLPAAAIVAVVAALMAPFGAKAAHFMPKRILSIIFGLFLILATLRLLSSV